MLWASGQYARGRGPRETRFGATGRWRKGIEVVTDGNDGKLSRVGAKVSVR